MPITPSQKTDIEQVVDAILKATGSRGKRQLSSMFLDLVDKESWPEYYEVIPQPRCLNGVKDSLAKNKYKNPLEVYEDLTLVFLNALHYNEEGSQIAKDAATLRTLLDTQWKESPGLPTPPNSLPASSAQKSHKKSSPVPAAPPRATRPSTPAQPAAGPSTPMRTRPQRHSQPPAPVAAAATAAAAAPAPSSPNRHDSPDMDVDVGGTPEPENMGQEQEHEHEHENEHEHATAMDGEGDAIIKQLERGLPRWEGLADVGWSADLSKDRMLEVLNVVKGFKDAKGNRIAASIEALPEETTVPDLSFNHPLSLATIEKNVQEDAYESSQAFDKDISKLFLKGRRSYDSSTEAYGHVLHLQRLYQALTSASPPPGPPYTSTTHFASLRAGPGTARPLHSSDAEGVPGVTTFRVSSKDRTFVERVDFKGWTVRLADWLHLSNPDDPGRPIVAQVFKCWVSEEPSKKGQPGMTVCWYYRPEQTFHPASRQFWEQEVFKTSHFADHPLEDIIEKIACQFTARHIRGRPRPPFWYPSWPLYVCDSRYNDRERIFVKIKNWNSCVPEEVRKSREFMPIYPFERSVFPRRFASPFVAGKLKGVPGGIGDVLERAEGEKLEGGGIGRKRPKRNAAGQLVTPQIKSEHTDRTGPNRGLYVGTPAAGLKSAGNNIQQYPQGPSQLPLQAPVVPQRGGADRSIVTALGGKAVLGANASLEKLPAETAKHFDRDPETNEVLWFAAPPVDMAHVPPPRYSINYLHHLAKKRKLAMDRAAATHADKVELEPKRRTPVRSMAERIDAVLREHGVA